MATIRQQRVQELLYQELSILIANELEDPQLSLLTVTSVHVSRDLRNAKVYVHHEDKEIPRRVILRRLSRATPFVRRQLAERLTLRFVPELLFYYDDSPERAARVDELIEHIRAEREQENAEENTEKIEGNAGSPPSAGENPSRAEAPAEPNDGEALP